MSPEKNQPLVESEGNAVNRLLTLIIDWLTQRLSEAEECSISQVGSINHSFRMRKKSDQLLINTFDLHAPQQSSHFDTD